jgi:hypothetical protein
MDLPREGRDRREYPEVSYSIVGAIVTGRMESLFRPRRRSRPLRKGIMSRWW